MHLRSGREYGSNMENGEQKSEATNKRFEPLKKKFEEHDQVIGDVRKENREFDSIHQEVKGLYTCLDERFKPLEAN